MPGSFLWLVPPASHPLHTILTNLITTTLPALLSPSPHNPTFVPHLTLTSDIPPDTHGPDPQAWLDSIPWPSRPGSVRVRLLPSGPRTDDDAFFRRCYLPVDPGGGVADLAALARAWAVEGEGGAESGAGGEKTAAWLQSWLAGFGPHVSLVYGNDPIDEAKLDEVRRAVREAGVKLEGEAPVSGEDGWDGWEGGVIWLIPAGRPVSQWSPIATREL